MRFNTRLVIFLYVISYLKSLLSSFIFFIGLICAAEHYDLPELLQACFHHAKQFLRIDVVCSMLISLENYYWRYTSASELVNMILAFVETRAYALFQNNEFLNLSESMVQMIMCRNLEVSEVKKFEAMLAWAKNKVQVSRFKDNNIIYGQMLLNIFFS